MFTQNEGKALKNGCRRNGASLKKINSSCDASNRQIYALLRDWRGPSNRIEIVQKKRAKEVSVGNRYRNSDPIPESHHPTTCLLNMSFGALG